MMPNPQPLTPPELLHLGRPTRDTFRRGLALLGRETLWAGNLFVYLTLSVLAVRTISQFVKTLLPEGVWDRAPDLMRELTPTTPSTNGGGAASPAIEVEIDGEKFYKHETMYDAQEWPCPLRKSTACASCEHFVRAGNGRIFCAAVTKMRTRHLEQFRRLDLDEIRQMIRDGNRAESREWHV